MSKDKNNIDELFRSKLGDYSLEAPEHVWKAIEARRTPLHRAINYFKGKKGAAAISAVLLLVSISSVALWYNTDEVLQQPIAATQTAPASQTPIHAATMEENNELAPNTDNSNSNANPTVAATPIHTAAQNPTPVAAAVNNTNSAAPRQNANENNGGSNNATPTAPIGTPTPNTNTTQTTTDGKNLLDNNNSVTPTAPAETNPAEPENGTQQEGNVLADTETEVETDGNQNTEEAKGQQNTTVKPVYALGKYTADIYGGVAFAGRSLSANGAAQNYIQAKQHAESYQPGFSLGFRLNYDATKLITIRAGVQYTQFAERLKFENQYNYTRIDTVHGVILDPVTQQPIRYITRIDTTNGTNTVNENATNTVSFIDVPVQIEWNVVRNKNLNIFATTGAALNLRFVQQGYQINPQLDGIHQLTTKNTPYKPTAGVSLMAGIGVNYKLTPRYSVLFETTYRQGISSVMKSDAGMQQTFRIFTGSVGLRYRF